MYPTPDAPSAEHFAWCLDPRETNPTSIWDYENLDDGTLFYLCGREPLAPDTAPSLDPGPSSAPASPSSDAARKLSCSQLLPPCNPIQGVSLPRPLAISPHLCPLSTVHSPDLVQGIIFFSQVLYRCPAVLDRASPSYSRTQSTTEMNMPCSLSRTIDGSCCSED